jgi:O-antigen/teichoic acid export membrane protein
MSGVGTFLKQWLKKNITLLTNASSLIGTTAITSLFGFVYWWVAARQFSLDAVGIASASISVMTLLGSCCMLGLGTLLITELPRQPDQAPSLISTALILAGGLGTLAGLGFVLIAPYISPNFQPLRANAIVIIIFVSGVGLTSISLALDQALVGLLQARLQLWRNTFFAISKLALLLAVSLWASQKIGMTIYLTWAIAIVFSLLSLLRFIKHDGKRTVRAYLPQWRLVRKLGPNALQHYLLNMILQIPVFLMPVLVTMLLSTRANAWFYVSWMIASFVFVVPIALTNVLHAMNSANPSSLSQKIRATMGIAVITCILSNLVLQFGTKQVLGLFGQTYADQASWALRILALCSFPLIIRYHYMSICRIQDRIVHAMFSMIPGTLLELVAAVLGAHFAGLAGMTLGWLSVLCMEALFMSPTIARILRPSQNVSPVIEGENTFVLEPTWLIETVAMPTIKLQSMKRGSAEVDVSRLETLRLAPLRQVMKKTSIMPHSNPGFDEIPPDFSGSNVPLKPIRLRPEKEPTKNTLTMDTPATLPALTSISNSDESNLHVL